MVFDRNGRIVRTIKRGNYPPLERRESLFSHSIDIYFTRKNAGSPKILHSSSSAFSMSLKISSLYGLFNLALNPYFSYSATILSLE